MQSFKTLSVGIEGELGYLTLERPAQRNALNATLLQELAMAAQWFDQQPDIRVVIVRGEGPCFSVGADIKDLPVKQALPDSGLPWHQRREIGQQGKRAIDALANMRAVTLAQVQGAVIGGGVLVMLACDFRFVAEKTRMAIPEVALGVPLAWGGIPRLVREIGPLHTKDLVMTGRFFTPDEAVRMGMVNEVVGNEALANRTRECAQALLSQPSVSLAITKEHINAAAEQLATTSGSFADGDVLLGLLQDPEAQKAVAAYLDRLGAETHGKTSK